jgi:hypothetical protein
MSDIRCVRDETGPPSPGAAALKLPYLALRNIRKRWHASPDWHAAITHFALLFPERFVPDPRAV